AWIPETSPFLPSPQDLDWVRRPARRSIVIFGTMTPKLIARTMLTAVTPSAIVAPNRSNVVFEALASWRRPLAILNRNTPGIIDTTEAKPIAANGIWLRRATGVKISPTTRQATNAPLAAPAPTESAHHLRACASIPTATGQPNIRSGVEKNMLYAATATPAAITSSHRVTGLPGSPTGKETPRSPSPRSRPDEIARITRPA